MHDDTTVPAANPRPESSLLPASLSNPASLFWLWVLPIGILLALNLQGYRLIGENMDSGQVAHARLFGIAGVANLLCGLALGLARFRYPRLPAWAPAVAALVAQVAYLWFSLAIADDLIPRNVAAWIFPPQRFIGSQFTFVMVPLAHAVLQLACLPCKLSVTKTIATAVAVTVAAPILLYLLFLGLNETHAGFDLRVIISVTGIVILGLAMFVGLVRALVYGLHRLSAWRTAGERAAIVVVALLLPLGGLALNRTIDFPVDFQAWEVYALVIANTAIILFASFQHGGRPLLSFALLCTTFPFSLYFFIVFLPYTPLSILGVIALGLGFLVLSPTLLFVLHLHLLNKARRNPLLSGHPARVALTGLLCALLLPVFFTARGFADKAALHAALDYVFTPVIGSGKSAYPGTLANLRRALASHRSYKNGIYYPLLSDYYGWLVFDRLVLPDDKLRRLEDTFFGTAGTNENNDPLQRRFGKFARDSSVREQTRMPRAAPAAQDAAVSSLALSAVPAGTEDTTVTLRLTLHNTSQNQFSNAEYRAVLPLPPGVFVTGFRLHINGEPVPGRIFEKKTALWVYTMIRDAERRDPGLLFYRTPDELELRVFPVTPRAPSVVEIDFLMPAKLQDDQLPRGTADPALALAQLGTRLTPRLAQVGRDSFLACGLAAQNLPAAERTPYLHLLIDRSRDNAFDGDLPAALRTLAQNYPAARQARLTLVNHDVADLVRTLTPLDQLPAAPNRLPLDLLSASGGFALDHALAHAISLHRDLDLESPAPSASPPPRPVFVILSRHADKRALAMERSTSWSDLLPALELAELGADGTWAHHLSPAPPSVPLLRLGRSIRPLASHRTVCFPGSTQPGELEFWSSAHAAWQPLAAVKKLASENSWTHAASLQLQQQAHSRSPGDSPLDLNSLVQASRQTGVLLPATSYIVVENPAQWRMLEQSERRKLAQNAALAFRETPAPPALWLTAGFALWLAARRLQQTRRSRAAKMPT